MPKDVPTYHGSCLCGQVTVEVTGLPRGAGYCHCEDCRIWHAAPINAWAVRSNDAIRITKGEELLVGYKGSTTHRHWCRECGSSLMNKVGPQRTVIYAMVLAGSGYVHDASFHIHCDEAVLDLCDGLPKFVGLPAEFGGSGETVDERTTTRMRPAS